MQPIKPAEVVLRTMIAWLIATVMARHFGQAIFSGLRPLFKCIILFVQDDFSPALDIANVDGSTVLRLLPVTLKPIQLTFALRLRQDAVLDSVVTTVDHATLPLVILAMVLIGWPLTRGIREAGLRIIVGLVGALVVAGSTTPLFLAGRVQMNTQNFAMQFGGNPARPWLVDWMIFTESGGRWLIALIVAFFCIRICRSLTPP